MRFPQHRERSRKGKEAWLAVLAVVVITVAATSVVQHGTLHEMVLAPQKASQQVEAATSADAILAEVPADATPVATATAAAGAADSATPLSLDAAAAAAGLTRKSPSLGPLSARWAPLVLNQCTEGMPRHYAPCLVGSSNDSAVAFAEELIYPDFSIPEPGFASEEHRKRWREGATVFAPERFQLRDGRAIYKSIHGQNVVLRNVVWSNNPPSDVWQAHSCMYPSTSHRAMKPLGPGETPEWPGRAVLANTPISYEIQHWLDRVTKILAQTEPWRGEGTRVVSGAAPTGAHIPHVTEGWKTVLDNGSKQEVVHGLSSISVAEMVFACRTPLIHPYFNLRLRELMHLPDPAPVEERKTIMYLSRNQDSGGNSGGRKVNNEGAVLDAMKGVLAERGRGEEIMIFDLSKFPRLADLIAFMSANVSAIVGPHGGSWVNVWWQARGTLLLEFVPMTRFATMYWEEGTMAGGRYYAIPVESEPSTHNMEVDPEAVAKILREQLGQPEWSPPEPQPFFDWDLHELT